MRELTPEPLTAEAFAPFGSVIEASDEAVKLDINQGHAVRYDRLAEIDVADDGGVGVISLFRARPLGELVLKIFERHPLGSQSFVPLERPALPRRGGAGGRFRRRQGPPVPRRGAPGRPLPQGRLAPFPARPRADSDFLVVDRAGPGDNCEEVELAPADHIRVLDQPSGASG